MVVGLHGISVGQACSLSRTSAQARSLCYTSAAARARRARGAFIQRLAVPLTLRLRGRAQGILPAGKRLRFFQRNFLNGRHSYRFRGVGLTRQDAVRLVAHSHPLAADERVPDARADPTWRQRILDWYAQPASLALSDVGRTAPNWYGVSDLHGLIWEWTLDFS